MRSWGPAAASVGLRRLDRTRLQSLGLRFGPRRCVVTVAFDRTGTWSCAIGRFGAYIYPIRHEPDRIPLTNKNATMDSHGVLKLDVPLVGTHAPPRLAWQRYPRTDGFVEPWTRAGTLRPGLRFTWTYRGGGTCFFGSGRSPAWQSRSGVRGKGHDRWALRFPREHTDPHVRAMASRPGPPPRLPERRCFFSGHGGCAVPFRCRLTSAARPGN